MNGLADVQQTGRPPILTLEEQAKSVEIAMRNPQFPHRQLSQIKAETGKEISCWTLKRVIDLLRNSKCFSFAFKVVDSRKQIKSESEPFSPMPITLG